MKKPDVAQRKQFTILFGKHKGQTLEYIYDEDNDYFEWLETLDNLNDKLKNEIKRVRKLKEDQEEDIACEHTAREHDQKGEDCH